MWLLIWQFVGRARLTLYAGMWVHAAPLRMLYGPFLQNISFIWKYSWKQITIFKLLRKWERCKRLQTHPPEGLALLFPMWVSRFQFTKNSSRGKKESGGLLTVPIWALVWRLDWSWSGSCVSRQLPAFRPELMPWSFPGLHLFSEDFHTGSLHSSSFFF